MYSVYCSNYRNIWYTGNVVVFNTGPCWVDMFLFCLFNLTVSRSRLGTAGFFEVSLLQYQPSLSYWNINTMFHSPPNFDFYKTMSTSELWKGKLCWCWNRWEVLYSRYDVRPNAKWPDINLSPAGGEREIVNDYLGQNNISPLFLWSGKFQRAKNLCVSALTREKNVVQSY